MKKIVKGDLVVPDPDLAHRHRLYSVSLTIGLRRAQGIYCGVVVGKRKPKRNIHDASSYYLPQKKFVCVDVLMGTDIINYPVCVLRLENEE